MVLGEGGEFASIWWYISSLNFLPMLPSFPSVPHLKRISSSQWTSFFAKKLLPPNTAAPYPSHFQALFFNKYSALVHCITNFSAFLTHGGMFYIGADFFFLCVWSAWALSVLIFAYSFIHWTYFLPTMLLEINNDTVNKINGNVFP